MSTAISLVVRGRTGLLGWLHRRPILRSDLILIVGAPLLWTALYSVRFWQQVSAAMWQHSLSSALFLASLFVLALFAQSLLLIWVPRRLLRPVVCVLFLIAAPVQYFIHEFGTLMDTDMMRNVFATDRAEAAGLFSGKLLLEWFVLGVLPCLPVIGARWQDASRKRRWKERGVFFGSAFVLSMIGVLCSSASYASFFREYKPLRYLLNPAAPVYSAIHFAMEESHGAQSHTLQTIGEPLHRVVYTSATKPKVLFLVIGETARRANFQLQGYSRPTNPELAQVQGLVYFNNVTSCGTATAISLPCIFSHLGRHDFDVSDATRTTNLLDMLTATGVQVEWRDANSGCKGVCKRVPMIQYSGNNAADALCHGPYCFDEVMLRDLQSRLQTIDRDTVIVFHQAGSHGPAYFERYPPRFDVFRPACDSNQLNTCTSQEVTNAYDNSIRYTDHNLARQIALLQQAADRLDGALLYVSDHGESLGERGVYLHGMPYAFAPDAQKQVPLVLWLSDGFAHADAIDGACVQTKAHDPMSHDNVFHTVLGVMGVRTPLYDPQLDILSRCRARAAREIWASHAPRPTAAQATAAKS
ncbi:MAG: phosphoethanolamine--lipid A transferase [Steroidobacteraceae bacterium]